MKRKRNMSMKRRRKIIGRESKGRERSEEEEKEAAEDAR